MFQFKYSVAITLLGFASVVLAEDLPEFDGGEVVVTADGVPEAWGVAPVSMSVITAQDIASSSATTVSQLLGSAGGVHLVSSSSRSPAIDLRGFGMTASSNTLILIDGVRQNTNDATSPNLESVPLSSIERIEIVRGSGSVVYGGGTTGGVINIITKNGRGRSSQVSLTQTFGSFRMHQTEGSFNLAGVGFSLDGFGHSMYSDHYMQNAGEHNDSGGLGINFKLNKGSLRIYARSDSDRYRVPGSLTATQFATGSTQGNSSSLNNGSAHTDEVGINLKQPLGAGQLYVDLSTQDKRTTGYFFYPPVFLDNRKLTTTSGSVRYVMPFAVENQWLVGVDWLSGSMDKDGNAPFGVPPITSVQNISDSQQRHFGMFSEAQFKLWSGARLTAGGRMQRINDSVNCNSQNSASTSCQSSTNNEGLYAWQLGLRQTLNAEWSLYGKLGQSFRLPNSDELSQTIGGLQPQTSHEQELGLEWRRAASSMHLALFHTNVDNEIQYIPFASGIFGPSSGANINLPPTRHQGVEFEGQIPLTAKLALQGNVTWQQATYRDAVNNSDLSGKTIPMVPSWIANLGLSWAQNERTRLNMDANYVGSQRMDNDQKNQFSQLLPSYLVFNTRLTHQFSQHVSGAVAVNNLFNRHYAQYGISSTVGSSYSVYPGDPRNYQASITVSF